MQEQYPYRKYDGAHTVRYRKRRRGRNYRKSIICIVSITIIVTLVSLFLILYFSKSKNNLVGTWVYDEYTRYVFEESGHGELLADDVSFAYTYKINGETLTLNFTEDVVRDCEYTFSVDGKELTLTGETGTDGGTYRLNKK